MGAIQTHADVVAGIQEVWAILRQVDGRMTHSETWKDRAKLQQARTECAVLDHCTEPTSVAGLSKATSIPRTTVASAVSRLVDAEVIVRLPSRLVRLS